MERITKEELVSKVAAKTGMKKNQVENAYNAIFETISEELVAGNRIPVHNFGVFSLKRRDARVGRNPKTKEPVEIKARTVPVFAPGSVLRVRVQDVDFK